MRNSSKQFDSNLLIKEIIKQEVELIHLPEQIKHLWGVKLEKIAIEFIDIKADLTIALPEIGSIE